MAWLIALLACSEGDLAIEPVSLDWGEVDFQTAECLDCVCDEGCAARDLVLTNAGDADLEVSLPLGMDADHLCPIGHDPTEAIELGVLEPEASFILRIAVCGYVPGERDTEVTGTIDLENDGVDTVIEVPWSFTPIRNIDTAADRE